MLLFLLFICENVFFLRKNGWYWGFGSSFGEFRYRVGGNVSVSIVDFFNGFVVFVFVVVFGSVFREEIFVVVEVDGEVIVEVG